MAIKSSFGTSPVGAYCEFSTSLRTPNIFLSLKMDLRSLLHKDGALKTWNTLTGAVASSQKLFDFFSDGFYSMSLFEKRKQVVLTAQPTYAAVWDYARSRTIFKTKLPDDGWNRPVDATLVSDGKVLAVTTSFKIFKFDIKTGSALKSIEMDKGYEPIRGGFLTKTRFCLNSLLTIRESVTQIYSFLI
jgi:WD40 repeat protein